MSVRVSTRPSHACRIQARVAHLLRRRSSMPVVAQMFYHYSTSCIIRHHPDFRIAKVVVSLEVVKDVEL